MKCEEIKIKFNGEVRIQQLKRMWALKHIFYSFLFFLYYYQLVSDKLV